MPPDLPKTTIKFITALLKHQAKLWLGEDAAGIAAGTLIDEDLQKRLDDWLAADQTAKQLLDAAEQAHVYVQDKANCPDADLRGAFHGMRFDNLPSVQAALTELPGALDSKKLQSLLHKAFTRDLPNLTPAQHAEGARIYTDALLRSVGKLEKFAIPLLINNTFDIKQTQQTQNVKLESIEGKQDKLLSLIEKPLSFPSTPSPTLPGDLPIGSHLPFPRNGYFTGRTADLEKLAEALLDDHQPGVVINQAVTGMGGLGKTQLAVEFAYEYGHRFQGVHWLDLRETGTLESQIALCGSKMGLLNFPPTLPEQAEAARQEWMRNGPRLLILDNFEEIEATNEVLARLRHSGLRLLITSRRADWSASLGLGRLPLDEFSLQESLDFLRNYIPAERESEEELGKLADHLGYLPLALELAGRYLELQPRLKIGAYLAQLEKALEHRSMQNWKAERKSLTGHDLSLLQTFAQSWEQVQDGNARTLFIACGYCAPNTLIPFSILEAALGDEKDACDECLSDLIGLGLLKAGPSIHPLLAQFARGLDVEDTHLRSFSEALAELATQTNNAADQAGNYTLFTPLLPHVREAAERAEPASLEPAGRLWNSLGYHIKELADYAGARSAYERALRIDEATYGPDHPSVARDVNNLGLVLQDLGDHAGARSAYERALRIFEKQLGEDHPNVATLVNNLGGVLQDLGDHAGARSAYERALRIDEATYGPDHPSVARDVNNLGGVLKELGDHAGARSAYERALRIDEATYGPDHPSVARDVNNLGFVLKELGDHAGARSAYERALRIDEATYGPDHPSVAIRVNNLGGVLQDLGDHAGARSAYERALRIFEKQLGADHPNVATLVNNLGGVLKDLGDHAGARSAYERAVKIWEAAFGPEHPQVATGVNNLGNVLQDLGDHAGARSAFERALRIDEATYGPDHPQVATGVNNLGSVLQDLGDHAGARSAFERAVKIWEAAFGPEHPQVATGVNNLGNVLQDLGDHAGARSAFERAVKIWEAAFGPEHPQVATGVNNLGFVLKALGDHAGARSAYERALRIDEATYGPDHPSVAIRVNNLGLVLKDLGDHAGARSAFERAVKIWEAAFGPEHPQVATGVNNLGLVLKDLGDHAGARSAFERALKIFEKYLPPEHPNVKIVRGNLESL
ncbi:MAG: tetratricopeptide repeat protein [Anaerolineales bacterium]|nr:MAG: tetratricopeptide repeat protein [Anaerolineales bacterium]